MPVAYVQHGTNTTASGSSLAVTLTGVTAGNAIIVVVNQDSTDASEKTYSATDDVDSGTYQTGAGGTEWCNYANSNRHTAFLAYGNCSGGDTQVTVTISAGAERFAITVLEISGAGSTLAISYGENDTVSGTTKYATPASGFSPPDGSLVVAGFTFNVSPVTQSPGSGYTAMYDSVSNPLGLTQYREFATGVTDHRPEMTVGTASRVGPAGALYIEESAAGGIIPQAMHYRKLRMA